MTGAQLFNDLLGLIDALELLADLKALPDLHGTRVQEHAPVSGQFFNGHLERIDALEKVFSITEPLNGKRCSDTEVRFAMQTIMRDMILRVKRIQRSIGPTVIPSAARVH
jgi:hypothetical protein